MSKARPLLASATGRPSPSFNIFGDSEAANVVFGIPELARKTTYMPLDLTHQCRGTAAVREKLFRNAADGSPRSRTRQLFREIMVFFASTYAEVFDIRDGPPVHDPLAVLAALQPQLFDDCRELGR